VYIKSNINISINITYNILQVDWRPSEFTIRMNNKNLMKKDREIGLKETKDFKENKITKATKDTIDTRDTKVRATQETQEIRITAINTPQNKTLTKTNSNKFLNFRQAESNGNILYNSHIKIILISRK